jgi:CDP-diacylglycerol--serine O-phosphatidyltransferase
MKNHIPNFITLINLFLGCVAIITALNFDFNLTAKLLFLAAFADLLDGAAARFLKAQSNIGKDLDSLADVISFGFAPATILYSLWIKNSSTDFFYPIALFSFLITLGAALRLAIFNNTTQNKKAFKGLPTPAATLFVVGIMLLFKEKLPGTIPLWIFPTSTVLLVFLMLSPIPMFSFKMENFQWKGNEIRFIFLFVSFLSILIFREKALLLIMGFYIIHNFFLYLFSAKTSS